MLKIKEFIPNLIIEKKLHETLQGYKLQVTIRTKEMKICTKCAYYLKLKT